jgi:hypothetical protein
MTHDHVYTNEKVEFRTDMKHIKLIHNVVLVHHVVNSVYYVSYLDMPDSPSRS